jgi:hypothetical protein
MTFSEKTITEILAEMRELADHRAADAGGERPAIELLRSYADRIEAVLPCEGVCRRCIVRSLLSANREVERLRARLGVIEAGMGGET